VITVFSRTKQGARRVSPPVYKVMLAAHIIASGAWLGVVLAKVILELAAITAAAPEIAGALYLAIGAVNTAFPPLAIATMVSGVILSLGTKWGLLQHYWVATKLVLTVGVIATAVQLGSRITRPAHATLAREAVGDGAILEFLTAPETLLLSLSLAHVLMLGLATVVSIYKPWGRTGIGRWMAWLTRRGAARPSPAGA
jgi:hypothetical protein